MFAEASRNTHSELHIDMEVGVGLTEGQGSDPTIILRWSDDGGHTWSNEHELKIGALGDFRRRVVARRLGYSRDRIYEVSGTDPVKIALIDAYLDGGRGLS